MSLRDKVENLNSMIMEGKIMEAFELYYADDIVMQENDLPPTVGKVANRQRELEFLSAVTDFRGAEVKAVTVGDDVAMVEWFFDYTHKEWGERKYHQVSVQRWKGDKIVQERFYYGT